MFSVLRLQSMELRLLCHLYLVAGSGDPLVMAAHEHEHEA